MSSAFMRKALSNTVWSSVSSITNAVLSLFVAGLTIRWLGLEEAGFVLFLGAVVGANKSVFSLGLTGGCLRYVSEAHGRRDWASARRLIDTIVSFNAISTGILVVGLSLLIPWFIDISSYTADREAALTYGQMVLFALLIGSFGGTCSSGIRAAQDFRFLALTGTAFRIFSNVAKVVFLSFSPTLLTLGIIEVVISVLSVGVFGRKFYKVYGFIPRMQPQWRVFQELWRFSRWSYLQSLGTTVLGNFDRILVATFFSAAALPLYSMAKRGYLIGHDVIAGLASFFFPMLSSVGEQKHEIIERIEPRVRWMLTGVGIIFYGGMILVGPTFLNWIVMPGFGTEIAPLIMIFGCVGMISLQTVMPYHVAMATDRPWLTTLCQYSNTALTFLVMLFFAWQGSLVGLVAAHLCDFFAVVLHYFLINRANRRPGALIYQIVSPIITIMVAWMLIMGVWSFLYLQEAAWHYWILGGAVAIPMAALLALFLERLMGDRYRSLETVRSIQTLAGERFSPLRFLRIPFV